jgi:hypothetical protein
LERYRPWNNPSNWQWRPRHRQDQKFDGSTHDMSSQPAGATRHYYLPKILRR